MNRLIFLSFFYFFLEVPFGFGQGRINTFPPQYFRITEAYPLTNPAYAVVDSNLSLISGNKMNFGSFKIFRTNYLSLTFRPNFSEKSSFRRHGFGLAALTEKEGEYIHYNRFYLSYAFRTRLSESTSLAAGATFGLANNSIQGTSISPGGSALAPDGNIGLWLYGEKAYVGVSLNQLLNSDLKPIGESFRLVRNSNFTAGRRFKITPLTKLTSIINVRSATGYEMDVDFMNVLLIQNILSAGVNYRHHKSLVLSFGFENLRFNQGRHLAAGWFSYSIPFSRYVSSNIQTYEITISYKIL